MSNAYDSSRGNVTDRQRRRAWLIETYRADVDADPLYRTNGAGEVQSVPLGEGTPAARCYRCGYLMTVEILTVDRIVPGCKGGTYRRNNIRPSCSNCANKQGGKLRAESRNQVPVVRRRVPELASRNASAGGSGTAAVPVPDVQAPGKGDLRHDESLEG